MRNMLKATTLERKFPLLAVENGCIISKDADITVAFRVELPELFTVTSAEYEAIHSAWYKAIKVLPDYSIVHKQDFFIKENYQPDTERDELSFLSRSFEYNNNVRSPGPCYRPSGWRTGIRYSLRRHSTLPHIHTR